MDVVEPHLLQTGLLARTRRGRGVTIKAYQHLGITMTAPPDQNLFEEPDEG